MNCPDLSTYYLLLIIIYLPIRNFFKKQLHCVLKFHDLRSFCIFHFLDILTFWTFSHELSGANQTISSVKYIHSHILYYSVIKTQIPCINLYYYACVECQFVKLNYEGTHFGSHLVKLSGLGRETPNVVHICQTYYERTHWEILESSREFCFTFISIFGVPLFINQKTDVAFNFQLFCQMLFENLKLFYMISSVMRWCSYFGQMKQ